jgi:colicin import membrane protein
MNPALKYEEPGGPASAALAVLVHVLLLFVLVVGVRWQASRPEAVVVELWDTPPAMEQEPAPAPKAAPPPEPKPEPKIEPKPEPKVEPKPAKPDIAVAREKKPPPKKEPKKKEEPKEEPSLKFDPTERIREQLAREMEALKQPRERAEAARPAPPAAPVIDAGYAEKIRVRIKPNIVVPADIKGNPEAIFDVAQLPTGEVFRVQLRKSSGHAAYDEAVERAIWKSSPLPRPDRSEQFLRELQLKFRPQE